VGGRLGDVVILFELGAGDAGDFPTTGDGDFAVEQVAFLFDVGGGHIHFVFNVPDEEAGDLVDGYFGAALVADQGTFWAEAGWAKASARRPSASRVRDLNAGDLGVGHFDGWGRILERNC